MKGNSKAGTQNGSTNGNNGLYDYEAMIKGLIDVCKDDELVICLDRSGVVKHAKEFKNHWLLNNSAELIGRCIWDLLPPDNITDNRKTVFFRVLASGVAERYEDEHHGRWFDSMVYPIFDKQGNVKQILVMGRDITRSKQNEKEIKKLNEGLEQLVARRTAELEDKAKHLEELNSALRVIMQKREEEIRDRQQHMMSAINQLIMPHVRKIQKHSKDSEVLSSINAIEINVNNFTASFSFAIRSKSSGLTPTEIEVALLIKAGKTSKDIAQILKISPETVEFHRKNIRHKLEIKHKKENLRSYLAALQP
jgi:DNA-binding CsgD family transcriptional regulator